MHTHRLHSDIITPMLSCVLCCHLSWDTSVSCCCSCRLQAQPILSDSQYRNSLQLDVGKQWLLSFTDRFFSRNVRCFLSPNIEEEASHSAGNCMSIHLQMLQMSSSKILSVCIGLPLWQQLKTWLWLVWEWIHHGRLCREGGDLLFCGRSLSLATQEPQTLTNNPQLSY